MSYYYFTALLFHDICPIEVCNYDSLVMNTFARKKHNLLTHHDVPMLSHVFMESCRLYSQNLTPANSIRTQLFWHMC